MLNDTIRKDYLRRRKLGWSAKTSLCDAKSVYEFERLGGYISEEPFTDPDSYSVRLRYVPDFDPSTILDGDFTDDQRNELVRRAECWGVWGIIGEFWDGDYWQQAGSCWGFLGDGLTDNGYDADIMDETVAAYHNHLNAQARDIEATRPDMYSVA